MKVTILGAGLAGTEAALQLASRGADVTLVETKPKPLNDQVYHLENAAELVCSNSLKSEAPSTASYLLKAEMREIGSVLLDEAETVKVPAGASLAVDRNLFAEKIENLLNENEKIEYIKGVCVENIESLKKEYPADFYIVATGPLTGEDFMKSISESHGYFYDAIAPLVSLESLNLDKMFFGSRYGKGDPDFLNIPMNKDQYYNFVDELLGAEKLPFNDMEKPKFFERCMPIEELARRGRETLAFGPFRPVGFEYEGRRPYALLQLRAENKERTAFNLVGCQSRMRQSEQKRVFSMLPGMENAEFLRYGSVHRNSFIDAPHLLSEDFTLKGHPDTYIAGQLSGVEGYVESIFSGLFTALLIRSREKRAALEIPGQNTMMGGILHKLKEETSNFQPVNANFALLSIPTRLKKREKKAFYVEKGIENIKEYLQKNGELLK